MSPDSVPASTRLEIGWTTRPDWAAVSGRRLTVIAASLFYAAAFHWSYRDLVAPQYTAWGAGYRPLAWSVLATIYGACALPVLFMPIEMRRPSQFLLYIQYFLVFIPSAFLSFYVNRPQLGVGEATALLGWMTAGMLLLQAGYCAPLVRFGTVRLSPRLFWVVLTLAGIGLFAYTGAILRGNFRLVGLSDVYDVRSAMGDLITASGSGFISYAQLWLGNLILPIAFAAGVYFRHRWLSLVSLLGYLFIFGISGQKVALVAIVYLPGTYLLLRTGRRSLPATMGLALASILLTGYLVAALFGPLINTWYVAVLNFRTFTIQGINLSQYYAFFQNHPTTNLSHLSGIRWFIRYPYDLDIPFTLGYFYYAAPVGNNSGMWATDAIGGFGAWAIPLVSLVASGIFWALDSCAEGLDPRFVALIVAYIGTTLANVSLGTTLLSGGLSLLLIVLALMPRSQTIVARKRPRRAGDRLQSMNIVPVPS